jgi:hypothetical protein
MLADVPYFVNENSVCRRAPPAAIHMRRWAQRVRQLRRLPYVRCGRTEGCADREPIVLRVTSPNARSAGGNNLSLCERSCVASVNPSSASRTNRSRFQSAHSTGELRIKPERLYSIPHRVSIGFLNVGTLRAFGYELLAWAGNFERDGLSAQLAFTYINSKIRYSNFGGTNSNVISRLNDQIRSVQFNKLTRAGGGLRCYCATGTGAVVAGSSCPAGTLANPH